MAKKQKPKESIQYWDEITEDDFINGGDTIDADIAEFNEDAMGIYGANVNYARQVVNIMDSLKPVERRILWALYQQKAFPGKKTKSSMLVAEAMKYHNHGNLTIYATMVGMAQNWKTAVPYVDGPSNFGTAISADKYGADRYTEAYMSEYAYECFFNDFMLEAVGTASFATGLEEPRFLPTKFPNVLVNGSQGVGSWAYSCIIPPYNISDIIMLVKEYINNPDAEDILVYPDMPTGCCIVENEEELKNICLTGKGNVRMRANIDIEEKPNGWELSITNIPFTADFASIQQKIIELGKAGTLKYKGIGEASPRYMDKKRRTWIDPLLIITIDKSLDPKQFRSMLFKLAGLEKTLPCRFNVVEGMTDIKSYGLKGLILSWITQRRIYKRSLYNHTINKLQNEMDMLNIMIELTEKDNLEKTIQIIKTHKTSELINALMVEYGMNSHQATVVSDMKIKAFTADAHDDYIANLAKCQKKYDETTEIAYNPKKIDKIILDELEDLRKYGSNTRKSPIIKIDGDQTISDSKHMIVFTINGYVKKLPSVPDKHHTKNPVGVLAQGDKPESRIHVLNLDYIFLVDSLGKYTIMPVYDIPNTIYSSIGETIYSVTRLEGKIKAMMNVPEKTLTGNCPGYLVTLTERGMVKATALKDYLKKPDDDKAFRRFNVKTMKLREGDKVAEAIFAFPDDKITKKFLIYTGKGDYIVSEFSDIPITTNKDTMGLQFIITNDDDRCIGITQYFPDYDKYLVIVTSKGYVKKVETEFLKEAKKRKDTSYLIKVDSDDEVYHVEGATDNEQLIVITKGAGEIQINVNDIPTLGRSAKGKKMIPLPLGDCIIDACIDVPQT